MRFRVAIIPPYLYFSIPAFFSSCVKERVRATELGIAPKPGAKPILSTVYGRYGEEYRDCGRCQMNAHPNYFGRGVARALSVHILSVADKISKLVRLVSSALNIDWWVLN